MAQSHTKALIPHGVCAVCLLIRQLSLAPIVLTQSRRDGQAELTWMMVGFMQQHKGHLLMMSAVLA